MAVTMIEKMTTARIGRAKRVAPSNALFVFGSFYIGEPKIVREAASGGRVGTPRVDAPSASIPWQFCYCVWLPRCTFHSSEEQQFCRSGNECLA